MKRLMEYEVRGIRHSELSISSRARTSGRHVRQELLSRADLVHSGGPWLVLDQTRAIFDGVNAGRGLGYNSGPLFGVAQYAGVWAEDWADEDIRSVRTAIDQFATRKPQWSDRIRDFSSPREMIQAYISSNVLDQFEIGIGEFSTSLRNLLREIAHARLPARATEFLDSIRVEDRRLFVHFRDNNPDPLSRLLSQGVLAEVEGERTAKLELPLATTPTDMKFLAERIISAWNGEPESAQVIQLRDYEHYYRFHSQFISYKKLAAHGEKPNVPQVLRYLREILPPELVGRAELQLVTRTEWPRYRDRVDHLQKVVYEPARQTSLATFDQLFQHTAGFGLLILVDDDSSEGLSAGKTAVGEAAIDDRTLRDTPPGDSIPGEKSREQKFRKDTVKREIAGMAAAGPLQLFPMERGTLDDPARSDLHIIYPLDLTVAEPFRGALGTYLKRAMALLGLASGHTAFHGRNRDRLAGPMWAINLSLGSYQIRHLPNDYPDSNQYRDCIYYRCPLRWRGEGLASDFKDQSHSLTALAELIHL